jgi:hypothetical protein
MSKTMKYLTIFLILLPNLLLAEITNYDCKCKSREITYFRNGEVEKDVGKQCNNNIPVQVDNENGLMNWAGKDLKFYEFDTFLKSSSITDIQIDYYFLDQNNGYASRLKMDNANSMGTVIYFFYSCSK